MPDPSVVSEQLPNLQLTDVDIYYNYVFDLGKSVNPIDAARTLLKTALGQAFRNYQTSQSEIADRYKSLAQIFQMITKMEPDLARFSDNPSLRSFLRVLQYRPFLFGNAYVKALFSPSKKEEPTAGYEQIFSETKDGIAQAVIDLLSLLAIHEHVDCEIFSSTYLESNPFVRVGLEPFGATLYGQAVDFDVTLTIHRTGMAILTAFGVFSQALTVAQVLKLQRSSTNPTEIDVPKVAIERFFTLLSGVNLSPKEILEFEQHYPSNHKGYIRMEVEEKTQLGGVFDAYRYFIIETVQGKHYHTIDELHRSLRNIEWKSYPVVFVRKMDPTYATGESFKAEQSGTLARLVWGMPTSYLKHETIKKVCDDDLSIVDDYSLYITAGNSVVLYFGNHRLTVPDEFIGNEWTRQKFLTTVVLDMLLFQEAILSTFNAQLNEATHDLTQLNSLKQEYIVGLQEFEAVGLSHYGSVHEIIRKGQEALQITGLQRLFELKLEGIESLINAAKATREAARDRTVKLLTGLVATIFAVSASSGVISVITSWPAVLSRSYPIWIQRIYDTIIPPIKLHPHLTTIFLYLVVVILTFIALGLESVENWGRRRKVIRPRIFPTSQERTRAPVQLTVTSKEEAPVTGQTTE